MPDENEILEQSAEQQRLAQAQLQQQRNVANNAQNVRNIADAASKSANPYAKAAGAIVKGADKLTGGKASEKIGSAANKLNKISPGGRMLQNASNKSAESGTSDRIGQALSKKKNASPVASTMAGKSDAAVQDKDSSNFSRKEVEEQTTDGGGVTFRATVKFLKIALVAFAPVMIIVVFMCLIIAGSQTYLRVIGLGQADDVSSGAADTAIRENGDEGLDEEITDENVNEGTSGDLTSAVYFEDIFVEDNIFIQKYNTMNFIATIRNREYNEADLSELEDFYSDIKTYENGKYNMDTVYRFFFKLLYIQKHYKSVYKVDLDMPLLMATLTVKSDDISEVFVSNTKDYKIYSEEDGVRENNKYFKYDYDWSNQIISKNDSSHDIEILAQHMVSKVPYVAEERTCAINKVVDGQWCYLVDNKKYKEFLKGFLEKKYFLSGGHKLSEGVEINTDTPNAPSENPGTTVPDIPSENPDTIVPNNPNTGTTVPNTPSDNSGTANTSNPYATEMIKVALNEYNNRNSFNAGLKYSKAYGFSKREPWCAAFVWYVSANTKYNGKSLYPDIIPFKSAGTGTYMRYFNTSSKSYIKFYYNDNCKKLSGKNGSSIPYTPKPGDYIFIDWEAKFSVIGDDNQDHTAMVEKYENGKIYTIEGNLSDKIARRTYKIDDCRVIGFGSWY